MPSPAMPAVMSVTYVARLSASSVTSNRQLHHQHQQELKHSIAELEATAAAKAEIKKLEKDMDEFKNNKEGKTDKLKVLPPLWNAMRSLDGFSSQANVQKQKAALQNQAVKVKTQQKEMQTAALDLEQIEADIAVEKTRKESLADKVAKSEHITTTTDSNMMTGGARRGGAPSARRACDTDAVRHRVARTGRGNQGQEANSCHAEVAINKFEHDLKAFTKEQAGHVTARRISKSSTSGSWSRAICLARRDHSTSTSTVTSNSASTAIYTTTNTSISPAAHSWHQLCQRPSVQHQPPLPSLPVVPEDTLDTQGVEREGRDTAEYGTWDHENNEGVSRQADEIAGERIILIQVAWHTRSGIRHRWHGRIMRREKGKAMTRRARDSKASGNPPLNLQGIEILTVPGRIRLEAVRARDVVGAVAIGGPPSCREVGGVGSAGVNEAGNAACVQMHSNMVLWSSVVQEEQIVAVDVLARCGLSWLRRRGQHGCRWGSGCCGGMIRGRRRGGCSFCGGRGQCIGGRGENGGGLRARLACCSCRCVSATVSWSSPTEVAMSKVNEMGIIALTVSTGIYLSARAVLDAVNRSMMTLQHLAVDPVDTHPFVTGALGDEAILENWVDRRGRRSMAILTL
ncbi:hypothetical protein F5148DRAFT_1367070 [Russula earlei]|uniref:Uncharacterized protein n=1 Tax=Russula earlei TaxID=71964 RepID=A0ACC0UD70_9AGAM|nr:hypothetical protein F5148DRAFT_1367070 [Russula earlei]